MNTYAGIPIKTRAEIQALRESARHTGEILLETRERALPGVTTDELAEFAERRIQSRGVQASFKGYGPHGLPAYPSVICISVNEEIVHGIPGSRELCQGDLLSLDFGVHQQGFHGDSAVTVAIGKVDPEAARLVETTREALYRGIERMEVGARLSDIGSAIQSHAEAAGFSIVREFVGHGIGRTLHEPPQVPNYGRPGRGPRLRAGMVFAIEPMLTAGSPEVRMLDDQWTAVTEDGSLSAHFEHTVLITENGPEVLTRVPGSH